MENLNEEKSLVKVDNSIFARMRKFFQGLFSRRKNAKNIEKVNNSGVKSEVIVENEERKKKVFEEPKLFNYDNPQYKYNCTLGKKTVLNMNENNEKDNYTSQISIEDTRISRYFNNDEENETMQNQENIDKNEKNEKDENISEYESDGYEGKEELEKKLMNYYESIKKVMQ